MNRRRPLRPRSAAQAEIDAHAAPLAGEAEQVTALSALQRRMDRYPQLSQEAQAELVVRYQAALAAVASGGPAAVSAAAEADRCLEYLVGANFKLVQLIAREKAQERFGAQRALEMLPDLVAEGLGALTEAARTYTPAAAPTFTKYAQSAVRNHIRAMLAHAGPLRVTSSVARMKRIATKRAETLTERFGRPPSKEELQDELLIWCLNWAEERLTPAQRSLGDEERTELKMARLRKQGMLAAIANIDEVLAYSQTLTSLSAPVGDGTATVGDLLADSAPDALFDRLELEDLNAQLHAALAAVCTEREREILLLRFGLVGGEAWTYSRIAPRFGLTAERIRQIERGALVKLADHPTLSHFLPGADGA